LEHIFCFKYQTQLALQHGGVYLVTTNTEFSDITEPNLYEISTHHASLKLHKCDRLLNTAIAKRHKTWPTTTRPWAVKLSWLENAYSRPVLGGFGDFDQ